MAAGGVPEYVTNDVLKKQLREAPNNVVVVDVRSADRAGGHIKGSKNIEAHLFDDENELKKLADEVADKKVDVVFHCMMSQVRGPKSARKFKEYLDKRGGDVQCSTKILHNGFLGVLDANAAAPEDFKDLLEDYDASKWTKGDFGGWEFKG